VAKGYKKSERKKITIKCPRCWNEDEYLEGTVGKCERCGQALAVLSSKPIAKEKDPQPKKENEEFKSRVREILFGMDESGVDNEK
jgi:hypothetical protein